MLYNQIHVGSNVAVHVDSQRRLEAFWTDSKSIVDLNMHFRSLWI
jgi:hypothetical protein